jgi:hypothetical protein
MRSRGRLLRGKERGGWKNGSRKVPRKLVASSLQAYVARGFAYLIKLESAPIYVHVLQDARGLH